MVALAIIFVVQSLLASKKPSTVIILSDEVLQRDSVLGPETAASDLPGSVSREIPPLPASEPDVPPSPVPPQIPETTGHMDVICAARTYHTAQDYLAGWKASSQRLSGVPLAVWNNNIELVEYSIKQMGDNCELAVRYRVNLGWFSVSRVDSVLLGLGGLASPSQLPYEESPMTVGRTGVTTLEFSNPLLYVSEQEALGAFAASRGISSSGLSVQKKDFRYFWDVENSASAIGSGGEPILFIRGVIDQSENRCFRGELGLVSGEHSYQEVVCVIVG